MNLDFRTKLFLTLILGVVAIEGSVGQAYPLLGVCIAFFPYCLGIFDKKWGFVVKGLIYTGVAFAGQQLLLFSPINTLTMIINLYCGIILRVLPGVMMGYYTMTTTTMSDLVYSLKQSKMPDTIIIPISVMFRFFYSIKEDYQKISEAMWMHGLDYRLLFKKPLRLLEYKFVPLLMVTSQTADNVAISAMTRGMKPGSERSSISSAHLRFYDGILILFGILLIYLLIRVKIC